MNAYAALLRGINVGKKNRVKMQPLREFFERLGCEQVESYLQSGNIIFNSNEDDEDLLIKEIEEGIFEAFGFQVPVLLRRWSDFERLVENNPFLDDRGENIGMLHAIFTSRFPKEEQVNELVLPRNCVDEFAVSQREIFLFCPNGTSKAKLSNLFFEKKWGFLATTRNWKTVSALHRMMGEREEIS